MTPTKPTTVAAIRGLFYVFVVGVIAVIVAATPADMEMFGRFAAPLAFLARIGEAVLLDRKQPPQAGPLGGGPA